MRYQGVLHHWLDDKGYGFIEPQGGGEQVFVHANAFQNQARRPKVGDALKFDPVRAKDGRYQAKRVLFADEPQTIPVDKPSSSSRRRGMQRFFFLVRIFVSCGFLALLFVLALQRQLPLPVFLVYLGISLFTLVWYWIDKNAAQRQHWRTPELQLHLLALGGGWPGAMLAQPLFRHKISKTSFLISFWFTVLLNLAALGWWWFLP